MTDDHDTAVTFGGFHHAGVASGEGFCVFNDVAITARMLLEQYPVKRILVMDTDAHQGNGTMDIFYDDPNVLFLSVHQDPHTLYPGRGFVHETGTGAGEGYTVNIPMPMYSGNDQYRYVLSEILIPLAEEFKPDVIIQNGGADPHYADHLTQLGVNLDGLSAITRIVRETADRTSKKLVSMIVSGYGDLVPYGWLALISGVSGYDIDFDELVREEGIIEPSWDGAEYGKVRKRTEDMVKTLKKELEPYWRCFR
jgi:acetoin utilization protein AcuC